MKDDPFASSNNTTVETAKPEPFVCSSITAPEAAKLKPFISSSSTAAQVPLAIDTTGTEEMTEVRVLDVGGGVDLFGGSSVLILRKIVTFHDRASLCDCCFLLFVFLPGVLAC